MSDIAIPTLPKYIDKPSCEELRVAAGGRSLVGHSRSIPIVDEVPRFVDSDNYAASFGEQWRIFAKTQLDSETGQPISEGRFFRALQELPAWLQGKVVLEAGCGAGRFTEILLKYGAAVDSVDISRAVETNRLNCPISNTHRVTQADINDLPFPARAYDLVMCLGVVQHTPDSRRTIATLAEYVRPGGILLFDHYLSGFLRGPNRRLGTRLMRRHVLSLSLEKRLPFVERLVSWWYPIHRAVGKSRAASHLLRTFSPIVTYHDSLPLTEDQHVQWSLLDSHDSLTDSFKATLTLKEAIKILADLGVSDCRCHVGDNGVVCKCRLP